MLIALCCCLNAADGDIYINPIDPPPVLEFACEWRVDFTTNYSKNGIGALTISGNPNRYGGIMWSSSKSILNYYSNENGSLTLTKNEFDLINSIVIDLTKSPPVDSKMNGYGFQFVWKINGKENFRSANLLSDVDPRYQRLLNILLFKYSTK